MNDTQNRSPQSALNDTILQPGDTCWKTARANRAALLIDADTYFGALRSALLNARKSVHILGWDIDSRVDLAPAGVSDGKPTRLRELLCRICEDTPSLRVNLLLWDYSALFALEREALPRVALGWTTPEQIHVCLDDVLPMGASHHQKLVIVDDAVAFCGGLDLTIRRWDTPDHDPGNPLRCDPAGDPYDPFHDLQFVVDGDAAAGLAELAHQRWNEASCETLAPVDPVGDPWPRQIEPDFTDVEVSIVRTLPELQEREEVREVERHYVEAIRSAENLIYIENQYLTNETVAKALEQSLKARSDLEAVLVGPRNPQGWMEAKTMGSGRLHFMNRLRDAGVDDRVRLVYPAVSPDGHVMVHGKLMIVDDRFFTVGSANLNNRSMGFDTECNLAIEAASDQADLRKRIAGLRNRLLGEHLGRSAEQIQNELAESKSALALIDSVADAPRHLAPIDDSEYEEDIVASVAAPLADPERPVEPSQMVFEMFGGVAKRVVQPWIKKTVAALLVVFAFVGLWRWTPLSEFTSLETLQPLFDAISASPFAPLAILLIFVFGGFVFFPVTVLITLTAIAFDPLSAFTYSLAGALISAGAAYAFGWKLGRGMLRRMIGKRLNAVSRAVGKRGVVSVMTLRVAPVAPFTAVNMVCGAVRIPFFDFAMGSFLGLAPGILVLTMLGKSLRDIVADPSPGGIALVVTAIGAWIVLGLGLQKLLDLWRARSGAGGDN